MKKGQMAFSSPQEMWELRKNLEEGYEEKTSHGTYHNLKEVGRNS